MQKISSDAPRSRLFAIFCQHKMTKASQGKFDTDPKVLKRDVVIETYRSRGPGGQRKNKTETAVRLRHLPTGITVVATEHRSQVQNRKLAFERLQERLLKLSRPKKRRVPTSIPLSVIERWKEKKKIHSGKKRLRQKIQEGSER
jgi:protein subunit release factor B